MSEPSSSVPGDIADARVEESQSGTEDVEKVELDVDEEKMEAWDDIKADYQVDPDASDDSDEAAESAAGSDEGGDTGETEPSSDES
jgi:hypothetical protein